MRSLAAIIFDFDGVLFDCRQSLLLPGADTFVRAAARVVPVAIASGALTAEIEAALDGHGLGGLFAAVIGADRAERSKPSPDPFLEALGRIHAAGHQAAADRTVAIDDSVWGLVAARAAGLRVVGVGGPRRQADLAAHAELVIPGLEALTLDTLDTLVSAPPRGRHSPGPDPGRGGRSGGGPGL